MADYFMTRHWPSPQGDCFDRAQALTTTPGVNGWTVKDTSASGTPTYLCGSGGGMVLTIASTSEAEIVTMYQNDVLAFDIDEIQSVEFFAKVSGIDSVTTLVMGLASAQNDTPDSTTNNAWFRMEGSASTSNVVVETDDNVNDNDDKATGTTLSSTLKRFVIDFTFGKSDVRFYIDDHQRVAASTTFDMSNATGNLQPFFQIQKASGTGTPAVTIEYFKLIYSKVHD